MYPSDLRVLTEAGPLSHLGGPFLVLESEIETLELELEFFPSSDGLIFFPLAEELLSPSQILFLTVSFCLRRFGFDVEDPVGTTSDNELHLRFLRPYLFALACAPWLVHLDVDKMDEPITVSGLPIPDF